MKPFWNTLWPWLVVVGVLILLWIYGPKACAQPLSFQSKAALQSSTYSAGVLTIKVSIPASEATMIQTMMGKASSAEAVQQIGQEAADDVKKLSERMFNKKRDDARDFIPESAIDAALTTRKQWEKHIADSTAAAKPVGALIPNSSVQVSQGLPNLAVGEWYWNYAHIGKSYSPRLDFLGTSEVVPSSFQSAVLPVPTWEQAWPYVATVGILVAIITVALVAG